MKRLAALALRTPDVLTVTSARGTRRVAVTAERGFPAVAALQLAQVLAFEQAESPPGTATLRIAGHAFGFVIDAAYFRCEGSVYTLATGPYIERDSLFLPLQFVTEYLPRLTSRYRYDARRGRLD